MRNFIIIAIFLFISGLLLPAHEVHAQSNDENIRVSEIRVIGNRRVSSGTVLSYLPVNIGDVVTQSSLNVALERLFDTGLFKDIGIASDAGVVTINIQENPIINRINIEGNDAIDDDRLMAAIDVQPRRVFTQKLALEATRKLLDVYQAGGRFGASVEPKIIELDENRVDLVFEVNEGPLIKITSIAFSGNQRYSDRVLRSVISSRENRWWAFLSSADKYDEGRLDYDVRLLRQFYLARGYADIAVTRVRGGLLPDRSGFAVSFMLDEGTQYTVRDITLTSEIENIDIPDLISLVGFDDDNQYDVRMLEQGLVDITNRLGEFGYAFVDVRPEVTTVPEDSVLDIHITVGKARKNFVERIDIIDNTRTLDDVIRREMELVEGDAFNTLKLERSERNIRNLGYFAKVDVRNIQGSSEDQTISQIIVEEQSTGEFSVGIGYSTLDKASLNLGIAERNFLGSGRSVRASIGLSDSRTDFVLGLTEPYFLGRNLTGSASIFNEKSKSNSVTTNRTGVNFGVGFSAANDIYHQISYRLDQSKTTVSSTTATSVTGENGKNILTSSVSYTIGKDTRDNKFDPSEGHLLELSETLAGLGGDAQYSRTIGRAAYYQPYLFNAVILGVRGRVGHVSGIGEKVTQSQRFFLGGRLVRGFTGSGIGPRDTGSKGAVGGNNMYSGSVEIVSDLGLSKDIGLRWTAYTDFGSVWGSDYPAGVTKPDDESLRASLGVGLLWDTVIGPMSFYWADPISKQSHDETKRFQLSIGTRF
ncbi:outer membrane protein assembly factor BamA [Alphaproteobacteria bacterium]|nr:outer membrane protein assembly factor BamA [Alphaproteobacteria bacterium]